MMPLATSPRLTAATTDSSDWYSCALRFRPASQLTAACLPYTAMIAPTSGGKSESVGAIATLPFHAGPASARIDFGSRAAGTSAGSYASALIRRAIPAQSPLDAS